MTAPALPRSGPSSRRTATSCSRTRGGWPATEHAEDVLQDALLRALRAYPRLRHAEHLRAWLYRVTTTAAIDPHRARRRERPSPTTRRSPPPTTRTTTAPSRR